MTIKIGDQIRVNLAGETPYAEVLEIHNNGFIGKISNKLFGEYSEFEKAKFMGDAFGSTLQPKVLHAFRKDDVVKFMPYIHVFDGEGFFEWRPETDEVKP